LNRQGCGSLGFSLRVGDLPTLDPVWVYYPERRAALAGFLPGGRSKRCPIYLQPVLGWHWGGWEDQFLDPQNRLPGKGEVLSRLTGPWPRDLSKNGVGPMWGRTFFQGGAETRNHIKPRIHTFLDDFQYSTILKRKNPRLRRAFWMVGRTGRNGA